MKATQEINLILVEPAGAINLGSVARLCENFGIHELRLVTPHCDPEDQQAKRMAVKGKNFLENAKNFSTLLDAIKDSDRVIATCGRIDHGRIPLYDIDEALPWLLESTDYSSLALVFGREDRGLTNQELQLAHKVISLQTKASYPSLNLSHAVAIVLHELHRLKATKPQRLMGTNVQRNPATPIQLHECIEDAKELLLEIGFLLEHTAQARMTKIKGLLHRAEIKPEEVSLIRGILRQTRWAIHSRKS